MLVRLHMVAMKLDYCLENSPVVHEIASPDPDPEDVKPAKPEGGANAVADPVETLKLACFVPAVWVKMEKPKKACLSPISQPASLIKFESEGWSMVTEPGSYAKTIQID